MPNHVWIIPSLMGSEICLDPQGNVPVWVSYTRLAFGQVGKMRLAADGRSPGPPDGEQLYAGGALPDYYNAGAAMLRRQLAPLGWTVNLWGYDWRLSATVTGPELARTISATAKASTPATIVSHSFGGLVARQAWTTLAERGQTNLVRRIVTLGAPHQGSYGVPRLFSLDNQSLAQLSWLSQLVAALVGPTNPDYPGELYNLPQLVQIAATWPALYETMPLLGGTDAAGDPYRPALYGDGWPNDRGVSPAWLQYARGPWQSYLRDATQLPPPAVLTTVAGTGYPTTSQLAFPLRLGQPGAFQGAASGDNQVSQVSALIPDSAQINVVGAHADLFNLLAASGQLASFILDGRTPPDPAPAAATLPGAIGAALAGPPIPIPVARWGDP